MRLEPQLARKSRMSLTPVIDVVFLLLLFFMLASTFSRYAHVDVAVAGRVSTNPSPEATSILLSVNANGFAVNGLPVTKEGIAEALAQAAGGKQAKLLIRPAEDALAEDIVAAIQYAQASALGPVALVR